MTTPTRVNSQSVDITAAPRAILRESVRILHLVLGEERVGSARDNAWAAVVANRESARGRDELAGALTAARHRR